MACPFSTLVVVAHQVQMARHVVALYEDVGRPAHEVRLALDDVGDHPLLERLRRRLVARAGADPALVAQRAGLAIHQHRGRAVFQVLDEGRIGIRDGNADARRLRRAAAHVRKRAGALALA